MYSPHLHLRSCSPGGCTAFSDSHSSSVGSGVLSMYAVPICLPTCPLCHTSVSLRADGVPIVLRICKGRAFEHGPFSLGRWYLPIGITALAWVVVSTVRMSVHCFPVTGFHPWCAHVDSLCQGHDALSSIRAIAILGMRFTIQLLCGAYWDQQAICLFCEPLSHGFSNLDAFCVICC